MDSSNNEEVTSALSVPKEGRPSNASITERSTMEKLIINMNIRMRNESFSPLVNYVGAFVLLIFFTVGVVLLCNYKSTSIIASEYVRSYADCKSNGRLCKEYTSPCFCDLEFNITESMQGYVGLYYEWGAFDQSKEDYKTSKDEKQLAGILSQTPAESCGDYSYDDDGNPILPCGAIADSMFFDNFTLWDKNNDRNSVIEMIKTGLDGITEEDKKPYRNPPGDLKEVFFNFSKPINWERSIWQLDENNETNNGLQNENFIVWMKTDLKRKPYSRLNKTGIYENGLPAGIYSVRVKYQRKGDDGSRAVILASKALVTTFNNVMFIMGILCVVIALLLPVIIYIIRKREAFYSLGMN